MITNEGIKKPSYWAYWFLSKLGDSIISKGENHIITRKNSSIQVLIYEHTFLDKLYISGDMSAVTIDDRYSAFQSKKNTKYKLEFKNISGKYRESTYVLDRNNGSAVDLWIKMGMPFNLNREEIEYLTSKSKPTLSIKIIEDIAKYEKTFEIQSHGVIFVCLDKIYLIVKIVAKHRD